MFCYDLATSLVADNRLADAMDVIIEIKVVDADDQVEYAKEIKKEALSLVVKTSDRDPAMRDVKERALRAYLDMHPDHGPSLHDLGALLCQNQDFAAGIRYYELAQEKEKRANGEDYEAPNLKSDLSLARLQLQAQQGDGTTFGGMPGVDGTMGGAYFLNLTAREILSNRSWLFVRSRRAANLPPALVDSERLVE